MEAIEAVIELTKERDDLAAEVDMYESWFEALIGKHVTLATKSKKKTRYIECVVTEFTPGEGWTVQSTGDDEEIYVATFEDMASGKMWVTE
jgi:hypothetical protein